ncbi:metallophosphatase, partial [Mesorhizobium sp. M2E.F.Ca.ET.219.01.1.1]
ALNPPFDTCSTLLRLHAVIADYQPALVISLRDSFHHGGGAARMHESFRERLESLIAGRDWFWIAGNHDPDAPADLPGETVRELAIGSLLFRHEPSKVRVEGEISGHLHPCARIVQQGRSVRDRKS